MKADIVLQDVWKEVNQLCQIYNATNSNGQKLLVKFIKNDVMEQWGLRDVVDFNNQVLSDIVDMAFPDHFLAFKQEISNAQITGFVTDYYQYNLQEYMSNHKIQEKQALLIFDQIVKSIYSLFNAGYWTRNIRPQHFVFSKKVWKLQSLVLDQSYSKAEGKLSEFLWNSSYQAPEFYTKKEFSEEQYKGMLVWNLGSLLLDLLLGGGTHKLSNRNVMDKFKGESFSFEKIGINQKISQKYSPGVKQLLGKLLHHNPKTRFKLQQLFANKAISPQVASLHNANKVLPISRIPSGQSSIRRSQLGSKSRINLEEINKRMIDKNKQEKSQLQKSKLNQVLGEEDFLDCLQNLGELSKVVPSQKIKFREESIQNLNKIMEQKDHPIRMALEIYKSYLDKSELLATAADVILKIDFKGQNNENEIKLLNSYAILLNSYINLNQLAEGFNQNENIYQLPVNIFSAFQNSSEYATFQRFINFKRTERGKQLEQIRKNILIIKKGIAKTNKQVNQLLIKDIKEATFANIKEAYRYIVKFAYDTVSEKYNLNKKTDLGKNYAMTAMYVTYALTVDKLYIKNDIPENFKHYFEWAGKPKKYYVPMLDFKRYIENAPKQLLIQNSRFILAKYYNI